MVIKCSFKVFGRLEENEFEKFLADCSEEYTYIQWLKLFYMSWGPIIVIGNFILFFLMMYCVRFISNEYIADSI